MAAIDFDELLLVCEVGSEPGESSVGDIEDRLEAGKEDRVVDSVEGCGYVPENENVDVSGISGEQGIVGYTE